MRSIEKLLEVMRALRNPETGCPWDVDQDFSSIAPYTIEEAYEVADAIAREDFDELRSELGDLLFQVVFYAQMGSEKGYFDFDDIANGISDKLIRRHPHVFGSAEERQAGKVDGSWEEIKEQERAGDADASAVAGVARALPALKRAQKLGKRAARVGFDWPDRRGVHAKIHEELAELEDAIGAREADRIEDELGDVLFAVVNLARHLDIDPERALTGANSKFERRFREMEAGLGAEGLKFAKMDLEALDQRWRKAKKDVG
ncbi:MAG: nucleoside triphosphate pyrophosphohydrolase [Gammaproteobacteria bacterium]|nr:nucleoside triphosphate pyrophosphohydrolase [Gammaproteobacteria bacterium]